MSLQVATELEQSFVESINASRAAAGLPALKIEAHLNASAQSHSDWMADTGDMGHDGEGGSDPGDRVEDAGFPLTAPARVTENVGYVNIAGRLDAGEVDRLHDGLMQSEGHRDNILDPNVSYVGIGLATGTRTQNGIDYDAVYVTQNFAETAGEVLVQEEVDGQTVFQPYQDGEPVGDPQPAENTPPEDPAEEEPQEPDEEEEQAIRIRLRRRMLRGHGRLRQLVAPGRRGAAPVPRRGARHPSRRPRLHPHVPGRRPEAGAPRVPRGPLRPRRARPHLAPRAPRPGLDRPPPMTATGFPRAPAAAPGRCPRPRPRAGSPPAASARARRC